MAKKKKNQWERPFGQTAASANENTGMMPTPPKSKEEYIAYEEGGGELAPGSEPSRRG